MRLDRSQVTILKVRNHVKNYLYGYVPVCSQMSTLSILSLDETAEASDDEVFTNRQAARHACVALKRYFEAHMAIKADQIRRTHLRFEGGGPLAEIPAYKVSVTF